MSDDSRLRSDGDGEGRPGGGEAAAFDAVDRRLVLATQAGLPLVPRPYDELARMLGIGADEVIARLQRMLDTGSIRRIGAVPNHYAIGYKANGMTVWDVDDAVVNMMGEQIGALEFVTHCYRRPRRLPEWPYNLFAMVHGATREEVRRQAEAIAVLLGNSCRARDILFSTAILKKTGLRLSG